HDRSCKVKSIRPVVLIFRHNMALEATTDRRRQRGMRTKQAILLHAARVGSAEGLEAVSLQRLASDLGMSKSGLFAHFGSKEELQAGEIDAGVDPEQLAWELDSLMGGANGGFKSGEGSRALERGRRAIRERLTRAATAVASPSTSPPSAEASA